MNGAEVARLARMRRANLPVLFVTGFADRSTIEGITEPQILRKPFAEHELAERVRIALSSLRSPQLARAPGRSPAGGTAAVGQPG